MNLVEAGPTSTTTNLTLDVIKVHKLLEVTIVCGNNPMIVIAHEDYGCEKVIHCNLLLHVWVDASKSRLRHRLLLLLLLLLQVLLFWLPP